MSHSATVIVPTVGPDRAARLLDSLSRASGTFDVIVVDNGTGRRRARSGGGESGRRPGPAAPESTSAMRARSTGRQVQAEGKALVLLNDDSVVDEQLRRADHGGAQTRGRES